MPYVKRYLREGRQSVGAIEQGPGPIKTRGLLVSPIGGKPPLITGACGARCAAVYIGTSGQHGVCKSEADSLSLLPCALLARRPKIKFENVCSLPLSFRCGLNAKPDTVQWYLKYSH